MKVYFDSAAELVEVDGVKISLSLLAFLGRPDPGVFCRMVRRGDVVIASQFDSRDIFTPDSGGNSTFTRLTSEVSCNAGKDGAGPASDTSLTHGDLRKLLAFARFACDIPSESPQKGGGA